MLAPTCSPSARSCTRCVPECSPFGAIPQLLIFNAILERAPVAPVRLNPDVPAELERIINKALEKDRDVRCQSAAEIRADLKRLRRDTTSGKIEAVAAPSSARRPRWLWPAAIVSVVVATAAAFAWLSSPPPPPRVLATTQLTRDGIPKDNLVTDGSRLYITETARCEPDCPGFRRWRRNLATSHSICQRGPCRHLARSHSALGGQFCGHRDGIAVLEFAPSLWSSSPSCRRCRSWRRMVPRRPPPRVCQRLRYIPGQCRWHRSAQADYRFRHSSPPALFSGRRPHSLFPLPSQRTTLSRFGRFGPMAAIFIPCSRDGAARPTNAAAYGPRMAATTSS